VGISIVVVTWNSEREIADLLATIDDHLADKEVELVVVDNSSIDATVAVVDVWSGRKQIIRLDDNRGFGAAANVGVREASFDAVVLLNPDSLLVDDSLIELARLALAEQAICGPELLNPDGSRQPSASAKHAGWEGATLAMFPAGALPRRVRVPCEPWRARGRTEVGWLTGACVAAPKQLLTRFGPFDESLGLYGEDMDLGLRARRAGVRSIYAPDVARLIHVGERSTTKRFGEARTARKLANRRLVVRRLLGPAREHADYAAQLLFHASRYAAKSALRRDADRERRWLEAVSNARARTGNEVAAVSSANVRSSRDRR
jgi:N-acetylglucosaminyl-diphospho-decaprenol L-rhamnosyltransferase